MTFGSPTQGLPHQPLLEQYSARVSHLFFMPFFISIFGLTEPFFSFVALLILLKRTRSRGYGRDEQEQNIKQ